ncbi:MAG: pyridoxal phosphate-dependent aminotransferase [Synergistaceae bacterium]|jgi:aspartate aminotransferase|nr:pyridoxal phosphate-dependent aminotransferase [Synergistaceae bacterium]
MRLSDRALKLAPSATLEVVAKAKQLKREGKPVISFGAGEPDFTSPPAAVQAAVDAIKRGETHYTPTSGIPELKEAIQTYYLQRFGLDYRPDEILVGAGAKPLLYEAFACLLNPGDEVLLFAPAWVSYVEQISLCDGRPVVLDTSANDFFPTREQIAEAITPRTVGILVNTPNNPTGAVYPGSLLEEIAGIAQENGLWVIFDEIYERLVYGEAVHSNILSVVPSLRSSTLLINGVSKAYAMTGWRIGYALGPKQLIEKMGGVQGHLTSNPTSISQWASAAAIKNAETDVESMRKAFEERRTLILKALKEMPLIRVTEPQGAFYVFVDARNCIGKSYRGQILSDDVAFCKALLEGEFVAAVPGSAFLAPGFIRVSYSNSAEEITEGMSRLNRFLSEL